MNRGRGGVGAAGRATRWRPRSRGPDTGATTETTNVRDAETTNSRRGRGFRGSWTGRNRFGSRRGERCRPNYFVGFRIHDETIVENIQLLQNRIVEQFPELERCLIDPRTLHVTLCVMRLPGEQAIQQAREIFQRSGRASIAADPPAFDFRGLEFFGRNNVLYTAMDVSTHHAASLAALAETLHNAFEAAGFATEAFRKPYVPHLTIWKASKDRDYIYQLNQERHRDDPIQDALTAYVDQLDLPALMGTERPTSIELLSMGDKAPDGYYQAIASASLLQSTTVD